MDSLLDDALEYFPMGKADTLKIEEETDTRRTILNGISEAITQLQIITSEALHRKDSKITIDELKKNLEENTLKEDAVSHEVDDYNLVMRHVLSTHFIWALWVFEISMHNGNTILGSRYQITSYQNIPLFFCALTALQQSDTVLPIPLSYRIPFFSKTS